MPAPGESWREGLDSKADKQAVVDWVFDTVAERYDLGNDLMSAGWHTRWKHRLLRFIAPKPDWRILDIAAGTGDVTFMLAEKVPQGEVIGTDISAAMLAVADKKKAGRPSNVRFVECDATAQPFPDASFDCVTCVYAGRGFPDFPAVIREADRLLKPGGHFWNLDFARPAFKPWDRAYRGYMTVSGAVLGTVLHGDPRMYVYIPESMKRYKGQRWLESEMRQVGWRTETIETMGTLMAFNHGTKPG